jgi:hypothetical protein
VSLLKKNFKIVILKSQGVIEESGGRGEAGDMVAPASGMNALISPTPDASFDHHELSMTIIKLSLRVPLAGTKQSFSNILGGSIIKTGRDYSILLWSHRNDEMLRLTIASIYNRV